MTIWGYGPFENEPALDFLTGLGLARSRFRFLPGGLIGKVRREPGKTGRHKEIAFAQLYKALNDSLPETPVKVVEHRRRYYRGPRREAVMKSLAPPMPRQYREICQEPILRRAAAWIVYCFDIRRMKRLAISRLEELLEYKAWLEFFREPAKAKAAIRKQIRELKTVPDSAAAKTAMIFVNPSGRARSSKRSRRTGNK